jgi:hypothetical protein
MFRKGLILVLVASIYLTACTFDVCSSKRMYVKSYEQFMKKVEKKQDDFTIKDWEEMDEKFERFSGECFDQYEEDLTTSERKQVMGYHFKYVVLRVKSELPFEISKENEEKVDEFIRDLDLDNITIDGKELEKFWKSLDKSKFKEAAEEFGKGFEKLEKALEDLGRELQETFEESREGAK